jgi:hypothetical protein
MLESLRTSAECRASNSLRHELWKLQPRKSAESLVATMKLIGLLAPLVLAPGLLAQSPVKDTLAYSRDTTTVVPAKSSTEPGQGAIVKTDYLIYVVVQKGMIASTTGACVHGKFFAATLQKVDSPVMVDHDPTTPTGTKDMLVKATDNDVYQVELGQAQRPQCLPSQEGGPPQGHAVVVSLRLGNGQAAWDAVADRIVILRPVAGS